MSMQLPTTNKELTSLALNALRKHDAEAVGALLEAGMHPDLKLAYMGSKRGVTMAVGYDDPQIFDLYVHYGAKMNMPVVGINNPLFLSVTKGDARGVLRCLAAGADVESTRNRGSKQNEHVMHAVAQNGDPEVTRIMLDAGGWDALGKKNNGGDTPGSLAAAMLRNRPRPGRKETLALLRSYKDLPRLDFEKADFTKADLFKADDNGRCPLDHPETWQRWAEVNAVLANGGEGFDKADLFKTDGKGNPWVQRAVECFSLGAVLNELNAKDQGITQDDLLEGGKPNTLLETVRNYRQVSTLMTLENCHHWSANGVRMVASNFDSYERENFVPNEHQLRFIAQQNEGREQSSGRGR